MSDTKEAEDAVRDEKSDAFMALFDQKVKESDDGTAVIFAMINSDREVVDLTPPEYSQEQLKALAAAGVFDDMKDPKRQIWAHLDPDWPRLVFTLEIDMRVLLALASGAVPVGIGTLFARRFVERLYERVAENLADRLADKACEAALEAADSLKHAIQERLRESEDGGSAQEDRLDDVPNEPRGSGGEN